MSDAINKRSVRKWRMHSVAILSIDTSTVRKSLIQRRVAYCMEFTNVLCWLSGGNNSESIYTRQNNKVFDQNYTLQSFYQFLEIKFLTLEKLQKTGVSEVIKFKYYWKIVIKAYQNAYYSYLSNSVLYKHLSGTTTNCFNIINIYWNTYEMIQRNTIFLEWKSLIREMSL